MRTVYIDTGAFFALVYRRDRAHELMRRHFRRLRRNNDRLVTSDPVVGETATRLRYDAGVGTVLEFRRIMAQAVLVGQLEIVDVDADLRDRALEMMTRHDHLELSYADCVGVAVARDVRADAVLGRDRDFVELGFVLEP